jgi:hypothetical protein
MDVSLQDHLKDIPVKGTIELELKDKTPPTQEETILQAPCEEP